MAPELGVYWRPGVFLEHWARACRVYY